MRSGWLKCLLVIGLVMSPRLAGAQCSMGGTSGGGHDHGAATAASSGKSSDKKTRQAIQKLLADPGARVLLMEAVLADPPLVRGLIDRIVAVPEFRSLAAERLVAAGAGAEPVRKDSSAVGRPARTPQAEAVVYRCPMHPEITSRTSGTCPKCGMALERAS